MKPCTFVLLCTVALAAIACGDKPRPIVLEQAPDATVQTDDDVKQTTESGSTISEPCDAPVCGDGKAGNDCDDHTEACDGADLRGRSCTDYGFAGGTLACSNECAIDTRNCKLCGDDARIEQCTALQTSPGHSYGLGIAWRDGVLLIATAVGSDTGLSESDSHPLRLTAFDADLKKIGKARELDANKAWIMGLVAVSDGFLIAYRDGWSGRGVVMRTQHLDENGAPDAAPVEHPGIEHAYLVARPNGGPLLVADPTRAESIGLPDGGLPPPNPPRAGDAVLAILLDEHGEELWATPTSGDWTGEQTAGAYTGAGFLFPLDVRSAGPSVWHIDLDGKLADSAWLIPSASTHGEPSYPQIAWNGTSASVVWTDHGADAEQCPKPTKPNMSVLCEILPSEMRWAKLDDDGAVLLDGPRGIHGVNRAAARWIASARDHVLLTGQPTALVGATSGLYVRRYDAALEPSGDPVEIVHGPTTAQVHTDSTPENVNHFDAVFGPERSVFVVWTRVSEELEYGLVGLAKVAR